MQARPLSNRLDMFPTRSPSRVRRTKAGTNSLKQSLLPVSTYPMALLSTFSSLSNSILSSPLRWSWCNWEPNLDSRWLTSYFWDRVAVEARWGRLEEREDRWREVSSLVFAVSWLKKATPMFVRVSLFIYFITALNQSVRRHQFMKTLRVSFVEGELHFSQGHSCAGQSLLHQLNVFMFKGVVGGLYTDNLHDPTLDYQLCAPKTWYFGGIEDGSRRNSNACSQDAVILCVDATTTQHLSPHFLGVVAHLAASVVAVDGAHRSTIVASADDVPILDDDGPH